jgi:small subunit ribosomal protein S20
MPNIKSAEKRVRTSEANRKRNAANKSLLNTVRRKYLESIAAADKAKAQEAFKSFCSTLDKSAKKGVISKNAASRRKSRAYAKLNALA